MTWDEYVAEYGCRHEQRELRKKPFRRLGKIGYTMVAQCVSCGDTEHRIATSRDLSQLPLHDDTLGQRWQQQYIARYQAFHTAAQQEKDAAWWTWYTTYLGSPAWHRKRLKVLKRAQGLCEGCHLRSPTQVHHVTYAHVGHELLFELVAICDACHDYIHHGTVPADEPDESRRKGVYYAW